MTFSWDSVLGAAHYSLYVLDATTNQPTVTNSSISGTSFSAALKSGDSYTWYLGAESTNGTAISWSWQTFSLAAATLASPMQYCPSGTIAAGAHFDTPTFSWSSVSGATHYYLYVLDNTTNQAVVNNPSVSGTSFTPAAALTPGHSFTWYIGAANANGAISWSWKTFALAALTAPTPVGPAAPFRPALSVQRRLLAGTASRAPITITSTWSMRPRARRSSTTPASSGPRTRAPS